jgi:hypothetical protein
MLLGLALLKATEAEAEALALLTEARKAWPLAMATPVGAGMPAPTKRGAQRCIAGARRSAAAGGGWAAVDKRGAVPRDARASAHSRQPQGAAPRATIMGQDRTSAYELELVPVSALDWLRPAAGSP